MGCVDNNSQKTKHRTSNIERRTSKEGRLQKETEMTASEIHERKLNFSHGEHGGHGGGVKTGFRSVGFAFVGNAGNRYDSRI